MTAAVGVLDQLSVNTGTSVENLDVLSALQSLGHASFLGVLLMILTAWVSKNCADIGTESKSSPSERIFSAANVLYLCFGMAGMMLLVNNNIARAFAIAAAIALVRFRIKVNSKILSMSLFYGVLTGMACGVGYVFIGYILVAFFGILQLVVLASARVAEQKELKKKNFEKSKMKKEASVLQEPLLKSHTFFEGTKSP